MSPPSPPDEVPDEFLEPIEPLALSHAIGIAKPIFIRCEDSISSTFFPARAHLEAGGEYGVFTCNEQFAGRGRHGRSWASPPGTGVLMTLTIPLDDSAKEAIPPRSPGNLNLAAAAAVCEVLERQTGIRATIKWPNDVHVNGRKLCGILTEVVLGPQGSLRGMMVGVGLNVNLTHAMTPPELADKLTSVRIETGKFMNRTPLAGAIARWLLELGMSRSDDVWRKAAEGWRDRCDTLGRWITIRSGANVAEGTALGLEDDGSLTMRLADGTQQTFNGGEVTLSNLGI